MAVADPWKVAVRSLRRVVGSSHHEQRRGALGRLSVADSVVADTAMVDADVTLAAIDGGVEVSGRIRAPFTGRCRRCSCPVDGLVVVDVREVYRPRSTRGRTTDGDEETYELGADHLDLAPLARDAIVLDLPIAPLCKSDCLGLCDRCGADLNVEGCGCPSEGTDGRWAALDVLRDPPGGASSPQTP